MRLTFIIPALNEAEHLPRTISAIRKTMGSQAPYEIILCDNGSTDGTPELAEQMGCKVIQDRTATISRLRNLGARESQGEVLVFIDSDISLEEDWFHTLKFVLSEDGAYNSLTGSKYLPPKQTKSFIINNWFALLPKTEQNYINSGHLVAPKAIHEKIGGFNEEMRTGEDYEYCQRAKSFGVEIRDRPNLKAYHFGFPTNLIDFIEREAWHGLDDVKSIQSFLNSKSAIASAINFASIASIPLSLFTFESLLPPITSITVSLFFPITLTRLKFGHLAPLQLIRTSICFEFYLLGRIIALARANHRPKARS